jgi:GT2 family glycosyltransferase
MEFPQEDYVAKLVAKMEEDEDVVVCGSDIVTPEGKHQNPMIPDGDWKQSWNWLFSFFKPKRQDTYDFIDNYAENHYCSKVCGCCLMVRMNFMEQIGFFDEKVFLYCEEAILAKQVEQMGKKLYYMADVQAMHRHIPSAKGDPAKRFRHWRDARIYFINEYSGDSAFGKLMETCAMQTYVGLFNIINRLKK